VRQTRRIDPRPAAIETGSPSVLHSSWPDWWHAGEPTVTVSPTVAGTTGGKSRQIPADTEREDRYQSDDEPEQLRE
jgi:hypothetical protein